MRIHRLGVAVVAALAVAGLVTSAAIGDEGHGRGDLQRIKHIVVIYEENHSFDNLYGGWEGVNGLSNADAAHTTQVEQGGAAYACLYQDDVNLQPPASATPCETAVNGTPYASLFGNTPFRIDDHLQPSDTTCPQPFQEFSRPNGWAKGQGTPGGGAAPNCRRVAPSM